MFQRLATGLQIADNQQQIMRFLTLTTAKQRVIIKRGNKKGQPRSLKESFDLLRKRIERATYEKCGFKGFKMNRYICFRTAEGNGVLHLVFWGGNYIPIQWLKQTWEEIHGAYQVFIENIDKKKSSISGLVGYVLKNYLMEQKIERLSYGWRWAWLGFCRSWEKVKYKYNLLSKTNTAILKGLPSWTNYFTTITHTHVNVKWWHKEYSYQALPCWKGILWLPPRTNRQTKFFYPNRGWNRKLGVVC